MRTYLSTHHRHSKPSTFAPLDSLPDKFSSVHTFIPKIRAYGEVVHRSGYQKLSFLPWQTNFPPPHFSNNARTHLHQKDGVGSILGSPCCRCYFGRCFTLHGKRGFHETKFSYWWWYRYLCCLGPPNFARFDAGASSLLHLTAVPYISWPSPCFVLWFVRHDDSQSNVCGCICTCLMHIYIYIVCVCVCVCACVVCCDFNRFHIRR